LEQDWRSHLRDLDRKLAAQAWKCHRMGVPVPGDLADLVSCMQHHTEWHAIWDGLATAQDTGVVIETEDGPVNPLLHVHMDAVVKRQLALNDPPAIRFVFNLLESQGVGEFDAYHVIARALVGEMWEIMKYDRPFDEARYTSKAKQYANEDLRRRNESRRGPG